MLALHSTNGQTSKNDIAHECDKRGERASSSLSRGSPCHSPVISSWIAHTSAHRWAGACGAVAIVTIALALIRAIDSRLRRQRGRRTCRCSSPEAGEPPAPRVLRRARRGVLRARRPRRLHREPPLSRARPGLVHQWCSPRGAPPRARLRTPHRGALPLRARRPNLPRERSNRPPCLSCNRGRARPRTSASSEGASSARCTGCESESGHTSAPAARRALCVPGARRRFARPTRRRRAGKGARRRAFARRRRRALYAHAISGECARRPGGRGHRGSVARRRSGGWRGRRVHALGVTRARSRTRSPSPCAGSWPRSPAPRR